MHSVTAPAAVANKEMRVSPLYYDKGQHSAGLWDAESIIFNRVVDFVRVGYFILLSSLLNGHPPRYL